MPNVCSPGITAFLPTTLVALGTLSEAQKRTLGSRGEWARFSKGETLFNEGESANYIYFLNRGRIKLCKTSPSGHEVVLQLVSPPQMVGFHGLIPNATYQANAVAVEETVCIRFERNGFLNAAAQSPNLLMSLLKEAGKRLDELYQMRSTMPEPVERRIANLLLRQALPTGTRIESWKKHELHEIALTKPLIGSMVGTATETAIRILSGWRKKGWISSRRGGISILDGEAVYKCATAP